MLSKLSISSFTLLASNRARRFLLSLPCLLLFCYSLTLTAFCSANLPCVAAGEALIFGFMTWSSGGYAWLANPLIFYAWIAFIRMKYQAAFLSSMLATALATNFLSNLSYNNDGTNLTMITQIGQGYYVWLAAIGAGFFLSTVLLVGSTPKTGN
jgi:hypothetical protein